MRDQLLALSVEILEHFNRREFHKILEHLLPEFVWSDYFKGEFHPDTFEQYLTWWTEVMSGCKIDKMVGSCDIEARRTFIEFEAVGTHQGRPVHFNALIVHRFGSGDKLISGSIYYDGQSLVDQTSRTAHARGIPIIPRRKS